MSDDAKLRDLQCSLLRGMLQRGLLTMGTVVEIRCIRQPDGTLDALIERCEGLSC